MSDISEKLRKLEKEVTELRLQNTLREKAGAWDKSWVKKAMGVLTVYVAAVATFVSLQLPDAFVQAFVPTLVVAIAVPVGVYIRRWYDRRFI